TVVPTSILCILLQYCLLLVLYQLNWNPLHDTALNPALHTLPRFNCMALKLTSVL
ncbi:hypothetical protein K469DRAFT_299606, partial [Zopfia rhizophila CBS 207.26]